MIRTAIAICALAAPMHAATVDPEFVRFQGDPEAFVTGYNAKGMPFFHKQGVYDGPLKGDLPCAKVARKDMKHDRVEPVCKPHFVNVPQGVVAPDPHFPMTVDPQSSDAFGYREAHSLSAVPAGYFGGGGYYGTAPAGTAALNFKQATGHPPHETPMGGPESPVQPPAIPLPASSWMLVLAIGFLPFLSRKVKTNG